MNRRAFLGLWPIIFTRAQNLQDFTLPDLEGRKIQLSVFAGKVVVLDFWATWCEPCIAEIPTLNLLQARYGNDGLQIVGVTLESGSAADIRPHLTKHKISYTVLVGNDSIVNKYNVIGFPTRHLINRAGKIHKKFLGSRSKSDMAAELEREIKLLLTSPPQRF